ncbi:MAG: truA2 [Parachlamydiales bacterium]|nr:truA2 [Parachlamydiales bacterium]
MANYQLIISYDGTRFFGWQKTSTGPSIEEALETAIQTILGEKVQLEAASRTDRGVHAFGQVVHFHTNRDINPYRFKRGMKAVLPSEIAVISVQLAPPDFHPTLDAQAKEYHYWICNTPTPSPMHRLYSWHIHEPLDLDHMRTAACSFIGQRDFSAFSNERTDDAIRSVQKIDIISTHDRRVRIELRGDRFLYKMARNIAGTLVQVGQGKISPHEIKGILESKDRKLAGMTAPAKGLFLMEVFYNTAISSKMDAYDNTQ